MPLQGIQAFRAWCWLHVSFFLAPKYLILPFILKYYILDLLLFLVSFRLLILICVSFVNSYFYLYRYTLIALYFFVNMK